MPIRGKIDDRWSIRGIYVRFPRGNRALTLSAIAGSAVTGRSAETPGPRRDPTVAHAPPKRKPLLGRQSTPNVEPAPSPPVARPSPGPYEGLKISTDDQVKPLSGTQEKAAAGLFHTLRGRLDGLNRSPWVRCATTPRSPIQVLRGHGLAGRREPPSRRLPGR